MGRGLKLMQKQEKNLKLFNLKFTQLYLIYFFKKRKFISFFSNFLVYKNNNLFFSVKYYLLSSRNYVFIEDLQKFNNYFTLKKKDIFLNKISCGYFFKKKFVVPNYIILKKKNRKFFNSTLSKRCALNNFWVKKNRSRNSNLLKNSFTFYSLIFNHFFPSFYFSGGYILTEALKKKFNFNLNLIYYNFFLSFIPKNYFFFKQRVSKKDVFNLILNKSNLKRVNWISNNSKFGTRTVQKKYSDLLLFLGGFDLLKKKGFSKEKLENIFNLLDFKNNSFNEKEDLNLFIKATKRTVFFTFTNILGEVKFSVSSNILKTKRHKLTSSESVYHVLWKVLLFLLQYFKKNSLKIKKSNRTTRGALPAYRPKKIQGCYFKNVEVDEQLIWYFETTFKLKQLFIENFIDVSPTPHGLVKKKKKKK